jgi:hypothetical protein
MFIKMVMFKFLLMKYFTIIRAGNTSVNYKSCARPVCKIFVSDFSTTFVFVTSLAVAYLTSQPSYELRHAYRLSCDISITAF